MQYERPAVEQRSGLKGLLTYGSYNDWYDHDKKWDWWSWLR